MDSCKDCQRLEAEIRFLVPLDYRRKMEKWREYEQHRRECHHVLHIAHAPDSRFTASAEGENSRDDLPVFSPNSHNRVQE